MEIAGLNWFDGTQELKGVELMYLASGGFRKGIERPTLSGLPSLELLKLVTNEDAFDKLVIAILQESSIPSVECTASIPIRSCRAPEKDVFL